MAGTTAKESWALKWRGSLLLWMRQFPEKAFPCPYTLKDLGYAIDLAEQTGVEPRMPRLVAQYYQEAIDRGLGDKYFPVVVEVIGQ